jgi:hypothetical protein
MVSANTLYKKQESSARNVQEKNKLFWRSIQLNNANLESEVSMNSLTSFRNKAEPKAELSPFENCLLQVKSNLKPICKGDDLNSVTSSDFSSRSDLETMNSIREFSINNPKENQVESKSSTFRSDQIINKSDSYNVKKNSDLNDLNESIGSKESTISKTEDDIDVIKFNFNMNN